VEWDDTLRYLQAASLSDVDRAKVTYENALRVYPGLAKRLGAMG
jgi:4-oxalmesaconate hydratase